MKKLKVIIFLIILLISISIIASIYIGKIEFEKNNQEMDTGNIPLKANFEIKEIRSISQYNILQEKIELFLEYIQNKNNEALDSIFIKNTNKNNIRNVIIPENYEYQIDAVFQYDSNLTIKTFIIFGNIIDVDKKQKDDSNFIINIDEGNNTFEIALLKDTYSEYIEYEDKKIINIDKNIEKEIKNISSNKYNEINLNKRASEKDILSFYFRQYLTNMLYKTDLAYERLNEQYKEKKFVSYQSFEDYIKNNYEKIEKSFIMKYKIEQYEEYTEYLCMDNFNNIIIFIEKEPMEYTVLLDEYTINDKIIFNQYKKSDKKGKAQINLEKFMHMINKKDYETAYSVLDERFKEKYFNSIDKFIEYIKNNLYEYNEFNYEEITDKDTDTIKIKTIINDKSYNSNDKEIKRFNIKLLENYGFNISFDI